MTHQIEIFREIPDYTVHRALKGDGAYLDHPLDESDPRFHEEVVPLSAYGVYGKSYYGNPNRATGSPVPGVSSAIYVRRSVAEKLEAVNGYLKQDARVADVLDGPVALNVRDGLRSIALQRHLREVAIPALVREHHPDWSEEEVRAEAGIRIAPANPNAPHPSGGAVDVNLIYTKTGEQVFNAQGKDIAGGAVNPEFLEQMKERYRELNLTAEKFERALMARRILFNVMNDAEIGGVSMIVNPVEVWHYSHGDKLAASMQSYERGHMIAAYFGPAPDPDLR